MKKGLLILALLGVCAGASEAGWKDLNGQKAPTITAKEWFNAGKKGPDLSALRGKVILLEFFATW